jgi:transcriptional regulator with XRE-family HTH domain
VNRVGRPEASIVSTDARAELAQRLRDMRAAAGLNLRELALLTDLSTATLSKAQGGNEVPTWTVFTRFVEACNRSPRKLRRLYEQAKAAEDADPQTSTTAPQARPVLVPSTRELTARWQALTAEDLRGPAPAPVADNATIEEFVDRLGRIKIWSGVSFDHIARVTGWGTSTLWDAIQPDRTTLPRQEVVAAFLVACDITEDDIRQWMSAWMEIKWRIWSQEKNKKATASAMQAA